jgi:hypothetical protein
MSTPTSSDGFAVRKVGKGTWSVQSKAVPGFKLGVKPNAAKHASHTATPRKGK